MRLRAALANSRSSARVGGTFALFGRHEPNFIRGSEIRATIFASASQRALSLNVGRVLGRAVAVIPYVSIPARWAGIAACGSAIVFNWMPPAGRPRLLLARLPGPAVGCVRVRSQVATTSACKSSASFVLALSDSVAPDLPERPIRAGGEAPGSPSSAQSGLMCCACAFCSMGLRR